MNTISMRSKLLIVLVLSMMIVSVLAFAACNKEDDTPVVTDKDILADGTYEIAGMQEQIPMHPENFGDVLLIEKKDHTYYITITILNNAKVERVFWKGRKKNMTEDAIIVKDGGVTTYMFAFDNTNIQKKLTFQIGGGKMPLEPPFEFKIDFSKAVKKSDTIADVDRPSTFL